MKPTKPTVLYIAGAGRSGSTLLERMLGAIKGWMNVGELISIFTRGVALNERCGCGATFDACPFWREVGQRAFGGWDQEQARRILELSRVAVRGRYLPRLLIGPPDKTPYWREAQEYVRTFEQVYQAISDVTGADVIVESSKDPVHGLYISRGRAADLRPIQLVRDPRGVAFSLSKRNIYRTQSLCNALMDVYSPRRAAFVWDYANFWAAVLRTQAPSSIIWYEDLVEAPFSCLAQALRSLALNAPDLEYIAQNGVTLEAGHSISGNPAFYMADRIDLRLDDAWRSELSLVQRCAVTAYTAPMRVMLAVDPSRRRD
jgi:hypothetical protein